MEKERGYSWLPCSSLQAYLLPELASVLLGTREVDRVGARRYKE